MEKETMIENLNQKSIQLREELISLEQQFNQKREEFLRVQGALEALSNLEDS